MMILGMRGEVHYYGFTVDDTENSETGGLVGALVKDDGYRSTAKLLLKTVFRSGLARMGIGMMIPVLGVNEYFRKEIHCVNM